MKSVRSISRRGLLSATAVGAVVGSLHADEDTGGQAASATHGGGRIKQSICKWCFDKKLDMEALAKHGARLGYQSIELIGPELWPVAKKHGLTCAMAPGAGPLTDCLNRKENRERCVADLRKNIDLAAEAGVPSVICFSGNANGQDKDDGIKNCIKAIKEVVGHAEKRRVNICIEYLNSKVDHPDYQFDHMDYGLQVAKAVGSPRFGILYDIYHAQIMEGDIIRTIRAHHEYILHYHTGGNPGRAEIDETQELNYPAIMKAIVETGYKGYVGQEFIPVRDPVESLAQAFRICDV